MGSYYMRDKTLDRLRGGGSLVQKKKKGAEKRSAHDIESFQGNKLVPREKEEQIPMQDQNEKKKSATNYSKRVRLG